MDKKIDDGANFMLEFDIEEEETSKNKFQARLEKFQSQSSTAVVQEDTSATGTLPKRTRCINFHCIA